MNKYKAILRTKSGSSFGLIIQAADNAAGKKRVKRLTDCKMNAFGTIQ